jgi:hypothetical protein
LCLAMQMLVFTAVGFATLGHGRHEVP